MLLLMRKVGEAVDLIDSRTGLVLCTVKVEQITPSDEVRISFDAQPWVDIERDNMRKGRRTTDYEPNGNRG
jgi:sRNA-binding carbon storage regulator CsrA